LGSAYSVVFCGIVVIFALVAIILGLWTILNWQGVKRAWLTHPRDRKRLREMEREEFPSDAEGERREGSGPSSG
jgi:hypothetical protein